MSESTQPPKLDGPVPGIPGAAIREVDELPPHLEGGKEIGPCTEAKPGALLFEIPKIARYLIRDGNSIEVAAVPGADRSAVELFLHTSARATLIHQRGELPLNAATLVAPNWKCVAICGPSAHGKSTIAAALCRQGWLLLADDVTRVSWNGSMAVAWPSGDKLKLWGDTCARLGIDHTRLKPVRRGLEKYFFPVKSAFAPAALSAIVQLRVTPEPGVSYFAPDRAEFIVSDNTSRQNQIDALGRRREHTRIVSQIASVSRVMALHGARAAEIDELVQHLIRGI